MSKLLNLLKNGRFTRGLEEEDAVVVRRMLIRALETLQPLAVIQLLVQQDSTSS